MITVLTLLVALILGFASCQGGVEEIGSTSTSVSRAGTNASVTGTVTYRERLTLTAGATLAVVLRDVSYADAAAPLIASHTITNPGHVPIQFKVDYNQDDIAPRNTYSVSARIIESDGRLAFTNDTVYDVITRGNPNRVDMLLVLVQPPSGAQWEGKDEGADWRTWVEVPVPVIGASLLPNELAPLLRVTYWQSTVEGCARPGNKGGEVAGTDIHVRLTLMQPPQSSWAIACDEEMVELDEVLPVRAPLQTGTMHRVVVNGIETNTFTPPDPVLGNTYIAESPIRSVAVLEPKSESGQYQLEAISGRPSGSCTQYNGYEIQRREPTVIEVRISHHQVADPEARCTRDFPVDRTIVPLGANFELGTEYSIRVNGEDSASLVAR